MFYALLYFMCIEFILSIAEGYSVAAKITIYGNINGTSQQITEATVTSKNVYDSLYNEYKTAADNIATKSNNRTPVFVNLKEDHNMDKIEESNGYDNNSKPKGHLMPNIDAEENNSKRYEVNETDDGFRAHTALPGPNGNIDMKAHLKYQRIVAICQHRDDICQSKAPKVCTMRYNLNKPEYKDFVNTCYLFLSNMCDYPGEEFNIVDSGTCTEYMNSRRSEEASKDNITNIVEKNQNNETRSHNVTKAGRDIFTVTPYLRDGVPKFSKLYDVDTAFDYHICPSSCPNVYSPVCFNVNRNHGMHFKYFTFINHCSGDMYYCKHWEEFLPPPGMDEMVRQSGLGWTFCGSNRYIQFHRFSEAASSMGHYGWLAGDHSFSHIMEPHQRLSGFG